MTASPSADSGMPTNDKDGLGPNNMSPDSRFGTSYGDAPPAVAREDHKALATGTGEDAPNSNGNEGGVTGERLPKPNKIYIGGLPENTREDDLRKCFERLGRIVVIELKKGYGFVEFETLESAEESVAKYHEGYFMGNKVRVELAHGKGRATKRIHEPGACFLCGNSGHWAKECPRADYSRQESTRRMEGRYYYDRRPPPDHEWDRTPPRRGPPSPRRGPPPSRYSRSEYASPPPSDHRDHDRHGPPYPGRPRTPPGPPPHRNLNAPYSQRGRPVAPPRSYDHPPHGRSSESGRNRRSRSLSPRRTHYDSGGHSHHRHHNDNAYHDHGGNYSGPPRENSRFRDYSRNWQHSGRY